jgi:hypothetical protein
MIHRFDGIRAVTMPRQCGGWLAVTPLGAPVRVGVSSSTEDGARAALSDALEKWAAILATPEGRAARRPVTPSQATSWGCSVKYIMTGMVVPSLLALPFLAA